MTNTTFKIEAHLTSNAIAIKMDGISIELNPSLLMDNIDTIRFIVQSITSKLKLDYDFNYMDQDIEAIKGVLTLAQEYLKDSDVWVIFKVDNNGQISSEFQGKISYNLIDMMSKINELFNS